MVSVAEILFITIVAFVPAILYALWIRSTEIYQREPVLAMLGVFIYGAIVSVGLAVFLESIVIDLFSVVLSAGALSLFAAIVVAPIVEELTKATGVFAARGRLDEIENGLVYGAAVGLGFAASENVLYFMDALNAGGDIFVFTVIARTLTSTMLHASASAIVGFGIAQAGARTRWFGNPTSWLPYYIIAVIIHALFNLLASVGDIYADETGLLSLVGLVAGFALVWGVVRFVRRKIRELDTGGQAGPPRFI
ncbi:PrsW family intramembrane metalloprotease [Methanomassiliicoccus luminyensis]|uniref:PrsW family intramembrane metalloprotease n=1 Tax=Methanomassiliicoccus luminyensis TaxID=1080712 RepID=UPI000363D7FC|nr:PrsW family intramembrane metalloprotease [Methanomassiliicoccus luminyensis]